MGVSTDGYPGRRQPIPSSRVLRPILVLNCATFARARSPVIGHTIYPTLGVGARGEGHLPSSRTLLEIEGQGDSVPHERR